MSDCSPSGTRRPPVPQFCQLAVRIAAFVQKKILQPGTVSFQTAGHRDDKVCHIDRSIPAPAAVVKDDAQYRRQPAFGGEIAGSNQVLVQQAQVDQYADCHVAVHRRLKFDQEVDIEPVLSPADLPNHIIFAFPEVVGDIGAADIFEAVEIQMSDPVFVNEAAEQVRHHFRLVKQQLVALIMIHGHSLSHWQDVLRSLQTGGALLGCIAAETDERRFYRPYFGHPPTASSGVQPPFEWLIDKLPD